MSNQYPGQPGDLPPTQVAPGGGVPPQQPPAAPYGAPQPPQQPPQQPYGAPPPPQAPYGAPQQPYGAPGGGFPPPPGGGGYGAPPTGSGGGGKKVGLIIGIIVAVLVLVGGGTTAAILLLGGDDDSDDKPRKTVTQTVPPSTDVPTTPETSISVPVETTPIEVTTPPETTDTSGTSNVDDAPIAARAYLDSLVTGNCPAVEGLSTPEWWQAAYGSQRACKRDAGNQSMSSVEYTFQGAPIDNGDGSVTVIAEVSDSTDPGTTYTATWVLQPTGDDVLPWLVAAFQLA